MANIRQSILVRTDFELSPGLLAAQVAHIHAETMRSYILSSGFHTPTKHADIFTEWLKNPYIYVHGVSFKELLEELMDEAKMQGIDCFSWEDTITLKVGGQNKVYPNMLIGAAIGPEDSDKIKAIIGNLPLL